MLKTLKEIKEEGWDALIERLGVAGATMFVLESEEGYGDYTTERKKIFAEKSLDDIVREIKALKREY
ncbi:hypothetical protein HKBW3S44_01461 [Candidatus Hakubella thermalkaliphila]|uniref:Uncharacterized protein n=1 Tax=Candidatus Hakubella thermalkaliphila TaxID=2754717 RepID=A0A6V8NQN3_9ACTN|nr:hypothetical protein [Candidatus Hakubella thermalkaliphila]MBT9171025.1 hypothetical protein [Actinomycetota bacterium]GFP22632.1 hypothetical protein HKBW3S09_00100 [Candidatus Hakubella thermalkaliphila]GFP30576.1 hypothetical protein HKBW3S34_01496 [Candidatus Hakubella thermalkaliphila]GFP37781.1 hypothetical protein HKBW3S44_01461 [Candidatus Hakubella thermalkaliphila]GFP40115.1 hypothetical protein HKBW3S47_01813 [Candidatus Hakubella thermalkaliphila]